MNPDTQNRVDTSATAGDDAETVFDLTTGWFSATRDRAKLVTQLAAAEAKLAVTSLVLIIALAVVAAIMIVGTWGLAVAGFVYFVTQAGVSLWLTLIGVALAHGLIAAGLLHYANLLGSNLSFSRTRQQLSDDMGKEAADAC